MLKKLLKRKKHLLPSMTAFIFFKYLIKNTSGKITSLNHRIILLFFIWGFNTSVGLGDQNIIPESKTNSVKRQREGFSVSFL